MGELDKLRQQEAFREQYIKERKALRERREVLNNFLAQIGGIERAVRNGIVDGEILCMKLKQGFIAAGGNVNDL